MFGNGGNLSVEFTISPLLLWGILAAVVAVLIVVSFMLLYHWQQYAFNQNVLGKAVFLYFLISGALLAINIVSLILYSASTSI